MKSKTSAADEAERFVGECEKALQVGRDRVIAANRRIVKARAGVASAITQWQAGFARRTFASVNAERIAANQKRLRDENSGAVKPYVPVSTVGNSVVDRTADAYSLGGFGAKRGGGQSFRRSASPIRLPSQR